jgi:hypothetical protein
MLIICSLFGACNRTRETNAFDAYKKLIPHLKLPYRVACYDSVTHLKLNIPDSLFKKYAPTGASGIIGIFKDTDSYSAILYSVLSDRQYPIVQTYDPNGVKLNDIGLIDGTCCGAQANCSGYSWGEITADSHIILNDSEKIFKMDENGKLSKLGTRILNSSELYAITNDGYIRLKNTHPVTSKEASSVSKRDIISDSIKQAEITKTVQTDTSVAKTNANYLEDSNKIIYKVQFLSSPHLISLNEPKYKILPDLEMYVDKNVYKYTTGHFYTRQEAIKLQTTLNESGFKEAFVVAFKGKSRV